MNKEDLIKERMFANSILRQLKRSQTYETLSQNFDIPVTVLARYVNGHVLPTHDRARKIIYSYTKLLKEEVRKNIKFNIQGHFNHLELLYNTTLLKHIAAFVLSEYSNIEIDKILSISTDGLPIAYAVGFELGVDVVYAKKKKEIGVSSFIEQQIYIGSYNYSLFIPENSLKKDERVLIVDDAIRSQTTSKNLIELCKKTKAIPIGIFAIISIENSVRDLGKKVDFPVKCLLEL